MKIFLDNIVFSLQRIGGISIVWYELLARMLKTRNEIDEIKILDYEEGKKNLLRSELHIDENNLILFKSFININIERFLNPTINEKDKFIFHSSYYRICNNKNALNITTVHDFIYEFYRSGLGKYVNCKQKHHTINKSDHIICISESTKKDLLSFYPTIDPTRITVIYNGVSDDYYKIESLPTDLPFEANKYILFVGGRIGYKNFRFAAEIAAKTNLNFLIVGSKLENDEINFLDSILKKRYKHLENIPNKKLNELYNFAFCLLYPSSYEGFGIPILEAQRAECPVIALNTSSIPEVIGDSTLLLNSLDINEALDRLNLLNDRRRREEVILKGKKNSLKFTWDNSFTQILNVYEKVLSNK